MLFADDQVLCDHDRDMMVVRIERRRQCMENKGHKFRQATTEHLHTTGDTSCPVRMTRYMETETVNLPTVQSHRCQYQRTKKRDRADEKA